MKALLFVAVTSLLEIMVAVNSPAQQPADELAEARMARDHADVQALGTAIKRAQNWASETNGFNSYLRLALLEEWMCEAGHGHGDDKLVKESAQAGIAAAEKAVKLNPNSSEAHQLLAALLGELIPHVFGGGPRYGPRSTREAEKAIQLDPKNAEAYVDRARSYFFTPQMFGGSKEKAIEMLKKAIALGPDSDTGHIWLAQAYQATGRHDDALGEINEALRLNPERGFAKLVSSQIAQDK